MSSKGIFTDCDDSKICPPKPCFNPKKNCEEYRCCVANAVGAISVATISILSGDTDTDAPYINFWKLSVGLLYGKCLDIPTATNITDLNDYISTITQYYGATYTGAEQTLIPVTTSTSKSQAQIKTEKVFFSGVKNPKPSELWSQATASDPLTEIVIPASGNWLLTVIVNSDSYTPNTLAIKKNGIQIEKISSETEFFDTILSKNDKITIVNISKAELNISKIVITFKLLNGVTNK